MSRLFSIALVAAVYLSGTLSEGGVKAIRPEKFDGNPYSYVKEPSVWFPVYIGPEMESVTDSVGVSLAARVREELIYVGCVSSLGFYEGEPSDGCRWRFHYSTKEHVIQYSYWNHPGNTPGSGYYAIYPNNRDIYINNLLKPSQGGGKASPINVRRFIGHAWLCSMRGFPTQGFPGEGPASPAMRSPYLSRPENWKTSLLATEGKAGYDFIRPNGLPGEIPTLQTLGRSYGGDGGAWIWRDKP